MRLLPLLTLLTTAACAGLTGCSSTETTERPKNVISHNDFESLEGWIPANPSLTSKMAHSGRFALQVGGDVEYSLTYINTLGNVSPTRLQKVDVSAWAMTPAKGSTAKLVVEVKNPANDAQPVFWETIDLAEQVKGLNKWTEVKKTFTLPATIEPTYQLRVYMWRGSSLTPTLLDDLTIARGE